ncbi:uncharacterized protein LOC129221374 [Uloborus diversus]|uniref:uncharacterized protein LOC129221374 n=1 Tax=Uloborus diversus TaxID=327109 RepID=UPI002409C8A7|nr:uncharacterized protein LOC129221374 [Uloborus diversus]
MFIWRVAAFLIVLQAVNTNAEDYSKDSLYDKASLPLHGIPFSHLITKSPSPEEKDVELSRRKESTKRSKDDKYPNLYASAFKNLLRVHSDIISTKSSTFPLLRKHFRPAESKKSLRHQETLNTNSLRKKNKTFTPFLKDNFRKPDLPEETSDEFKKLLTSDNKFRLYFSGNNSRFKRNANFEVSSEETTEIVPHKETSYTFQTEKNPTTTASTKLTDGKSQFESNVTSSKENIITTEQGTSSDGNSTSSTTIGPTDPSLTDDQNYGRVCVMICGSVITTVILPMWFKKCVSCCKKCFCKGCSESTEN